MVNWGTVGNPGGDRLGDDDELLGVLGGGGVLGGVGVGGTLGLGESLGGVRAPDVVQLLLPLN